MISIKKITKARNVLGIPKSATKINVRNAYKLLVKKWHPDINGSKNAHKKMQDINESYALVMKEDFNILDPWKDYGGWWKKQFGDDPLLSNISADDYRNKKYAGIKKDNVLQIKDKSKKKDITKKFLNKKNIFAVIGVSKNPRKYGNKIYKELKFAGYTVFPINPKVKKVEGDICYPSLEKLPVKPDVIDVVVPPKITEKVVKKAVKNGINKVWLQPGSESDKVIDYCKKQDVLVLHNMCIIIETRKIIK